jgi:hypothetical protein
MPAMRQHALMRAVLAVALLMLGTPGVTASPLDLSWHGYLAKRPDWRCADGTVPQGISGLEHLGGDAYLAIGDQRGPALAYRLSIALGTNGIDRVECVEAVELSSPEGGRSGFPEGAVDPETIRRDPASGNWIWASEHDGQAVVEVFETDDRGAAAHRILSPVVREAAKFVPRYDRKTRVQTHGAEPNGGIEGLAVAADRAVFAAFEAALVQDVDPSAAERPIRLLRLAPDRRSVGEFVYRAPAEHRISEIAALDTALTPRPDRQFLVLERVYWPNRGQQTRVQLALADLSTLDLDRDDVSGEVVLTPNAPAAARTKLLDFDVFAERMVNERSDLDCNRTYASTGGRRVANIEGMTLGPPLADGFRALLLVSANEKPHLCTQFIVLRIRAR